MSTKNVHKLRVSDFINTVGLRSIGTYKLSRKVFSRANSLIEHFPVYYKLFVTFFKKNLLFCPKRKKKNVHRQQFDSEYELSNDVSGTRTKT